MSTEIDRQAISDGRWRLHPRVALRPEPFGALAYHYGNRRLNFLRSPDLVAVVEALGDAPTTAETMVRCGIAAERRPSFERALASLARSDFLIPFSDDDAAPATTGADRPAHAPQPTVTP